MKAGRPSPRPDRLRTLPPALRRRLSHRRTPTVVALLIIVVVLGLAATCTAAVPHPRTSSKRPNIVFVLTDDLSTDLVRYMPHVLAMRRHGISFTNYTVTDSLCCPSRSSIFTGDYPHDTGIYTNTAPLGGYEKFRSSGEEQATFAVALQAAGYRTALMGKYLNGYRPGRSPGPGVRAPPGWSEWDVVGNGYREYDYLMARNGATIRYGHRPRDYLTTVLEQRATDFIGSATAEGVPFFLEVATFAPHRPYVPAARDARAFPGLHAPRTAAFDRRPSHAPAWLAHRRPLSSARIAAIDAGYRRRAQDVLSIDRLIASIEVALQRSGATGDTVIVVSSDNGYHMGEYRLGPGKMTAFDTDVNVPLVLTGPRIPAGATDPALAQNVDLAPTFESLAGLRPDKRRDGTSLVGLLYRHRPRTRLDAALVEHRGPDRNRADPDYAGPVSGNPPSYEAIRTKGYTYVQYLNGGAEYYNRSRDPAQLHNVYAKLSVRHRVHLQQRLFDLTQCQGTTACAKARAGP